MSGQWHIKQYVREMLWTTNSQAFFDSLLWGQQEAIAIPGFVTYPFKLKSQHNIHKYDSCKK